MRCLAIILFFLCSLPSFGRQLSIDRSAAAPSLRIDENDPGQLARWLVSDLTSERDKVSAIFQWITGHISYYRPSPLPLRKRLRLPADVLDPDSAELKPLNERVAIKVLRDRRTHCEGYARLFKSMCDNVGIHSEIVSGYARTDMGLNEKQFRSNHSWNAVMIDSAWYLLDATWASGYITYSSGDFVQQYNNYYFLTPPEEFIRHHYPDDLKWSLLDHAPAPDEFRRGPFHQRSFVKYMISDFLPHNGIIEASIGDTVRFEVNAPIYNHNYSIVSDSLWDSVLVCTREDLAFVAPAAADVAGKVTYEYPVLSDKVEWVHLLYNGDAILRYRLVIRKNASAVLTPLKDQPAIETLSERKSIHDPPFNR